MSMLSTEIETALDGFAAAWRAGNASQLAAFFAEDGTLVNPFGEKADGRAGVASMYGGYFEGMLAGTGSTITPTSIRQVGNDHAFVDATQTISAANGDTLLSLHLAALLRREAGGWRFLDSRPYAYATPPGR